MPSNNGRALLLLLAAALAVSAQQQPQSAQGHYDRPEGFVSDFARVLDSPNRAEAENYLASLQRATGVQFAVVTVPTTSGEPIEDYANSLARKWGIGQKGANEGLLMLLAVQDRKIRVEVGYGLEAVLPDGYVGSVQRTMREDLRAAKYGAAILTAVRTMGSKVAASKGIQGFDAPQPRPDTARRAKSSGRSPIPIWLIILLVVFLGPAILRMFFGGGGGRGGRWGGGGGPFIFGGGGGFGGSSGGSGDGGGFGGFGGGDFGGGGASSDW